jgi:beta-lactamase class A
MKTISLKVLLIGFILSFSGSIFAQKEALRQKIEKIALISKGKVGVAVLSLEDKDTLTYNGFSHMPMQSTYKFPLALAILDQVDKEKFTLNQKIHITKKDILPNTMSPLTEKYPNGNLDITLNPVPSDWRSYQGQ